jgi:histidinol-phosphate aminotransferase
MSLIHHLIRKNILDVQPYSSARSTFSGTAAVFLDANENSFGSASQHYNRYPDPLQKTLKNKISALKSIAVEHIFLGHGSDEAIDLLIRATCDPGVDNIIALDPSYGMYEVSAAIQNITVRKALLTEDFQPDIPAILNLADQHSKLLFLCSPNNPTGNTIAPGIIRQLLHSFPGLVILDEAYIDFTPESSWLKRLHEFPNLVILQTLSKAWGLAGLRLGMSFATPAIVDILNKIKPPYNISLPVQELALKALDSETQVAAWIVQINTERERMAAELIKFQCIKTVFPSQANFLLVATTDSGKLYRYLCEQGIIARNRHGMPLCDDCLRITIGTTAENDQLLNALNNYPA